MRLCLIREEGGADSASGGVPRTAAEAHALFEKGMRLMRTREDLAAFRIFDRLSRYRGHGPPDLVPTAAAARDFLDPDRSAGEKARTLFGFFSPTVVRLELPDPDAEASG
jgi:hypothetical protein